MTVRFAAVLACVILLPSAARATTASSLSDRLHIDGNLSDIAFDEWVLDATTVFPERAHDSRLGADRDIARLAVTWDHDFLYLGVDFTTRGESVLLMLESGAGGLVSLDGAGEFRRAIDTDGLSPNLLVLATPGSVPRVARADASHAFQLVDRATAPAVLHAGIDGAAVLEVAIPWSLLLLDAASLRVMVALTGEVGTGAGDAAPDPRDPLPGDLRSRVVLDRALVVTVDADADSVPDVGVSPRAVSVAEPGAEASSTPDESSLSVSVSPGVFAPDRGESATFRLRAGVFIGSASGVCGIYSMDGRRVREIAVSVQGPVSEATVAWDGRDTAGNPVPGGVYIARFDLDVDADGVRRHERVKVGVAVVR